MPLCDIVNIEIGNLVTVLLIFVLSREQMAFTCSWPEAKPHPCFIKVMWDVACSVSHTYPSTWFYFICSAVSVFKSCIMFYSPHYVPAAIDDGLQLFGLERSAFEDARGNVSQPCHVQPIASRCCSLHQLIEESDELWLHLLLCRGKRHELRKKSITSERIIWGIAGANHPRCKCICF